jgi:hypothetical protein
VDDLTAFITARLDEDEAAVLAATPGPWKHMCLGSEGCLVLRETGTVRERGRGRVARFGQKDWAADHADAEFVARHDPARVLREVAAKRAILGRHKPLHGRYGFCCAWCSDDVDAFGLSHSWPCADVRDIIAVWCGHPDYRQDWAPSPEAAPR